MFIIKILNCSIILVVTIILDNTTERMSNSLNEKTNRVLVIEKTCVYYYILAYCGIVW